MSNEYYNPSGNPGAAASLLSSIIRAESAFVAAGFAKLPALSGNANKAVVVNGGGTGLTVTTGALALSGNLTTAGAFNTTLIQGASVSLTLPGVSGTLATLAGTETLTNKTLVAPALGTPASGMLTNCIGTANGLTAGAATNATNAVNALNLSGGSVSATTIVAMGMTTLLAGVSAPGGARVSADGSAQLQALTVSVSGGLAVLDLAGRFPIVAAVASGGSGFTNGDTLYDLISGSKFTATVSGGVVTALTITVTGYQAGNFSNPVSLVGGTGAGCTMNVSVTSQLSGIKIPASLYLGPQANAANDAAAAGLGVAIGQIYRNGSVLMQRQS